MKLSIILAVIIAIFVFGLLVIALLWRKNQPEKIEPNYRIFFIMGIIYIPVGIALNNIGIGALGFIFMVLGLVNRKKWGEDTTWTDLTTDQKQFKVLIMVGLLGVLVLGALAFYIFSQAV
jgi:hypothetical protein